MSKKLNCLIIGAGDRGNLFGKIASKYDGNIVAVAEHNDKRRDLLADQHDIPPERMAKGSEC